MLVMLRFHPSRTHAHPSTSLHGARVCCLDRHSPKPLWGRGLAEPCLDCPNLQMAALCNCLLVGGAKTLSDPPPPSRLSGTGGLPGTSSCLCFLLELAPMAQVPKCVSSHVAACWWTECSYFKIMSSYSPKVMPDRAAFFSTDRLLLRCF